MTMELTANNVMFTYIRRQVIEIKFGGANVIKLKLKRIAYLPVDIAIMIICILLIILELTFLPPLAKVQ